MESTPSDSDGPESLISKPRQYPYHQEKRFDDMARQGGHSTMSTSEKDVYDQHAQGLFGQQGNESELRRSRSSVSVSHLSMQRPKKHFTPLSGYKSSERWTSKQKLHLFFLTVLSLLTRFYHLDLPSDVVFDEVHIGSFVNHYLHGRYFFDVHPPLAKLLYAGVGKLVGYDGSFSFSHIGLDYVLSGTPYLALRTLPALLGAALVPIVYAMLIECKLSTTAASLASTLILFDTALLTESKFIMVEPIFIFFAVTTGYAWVRFSKERREPFSCKWRLWLVVVGLLVGCTISTQLVGIYTWLAIVVASAMDLGRTIQRHQHDLSFKGLFKQVRERAAGLLLLPVVVYMSVYYIHFSVLTQSGPGDHYMSPEFQCSLSGNRSSFKAKVVHYGDSVTFKSAIEEVYLHSHACHYPLKHDDGKISSQGQQVTGYPLKDENNVWIIERPPAEISFSPENGHVDANDLQAAQKTAAELSVDVLALDHKPEDRARHVDVLLRTPVAHGDVIRLRHGTTNKYLLTHDVASPLTRTNMEVTAFSTADLAARYNDTLWKVDLISDSDEPDDTHLTSHLSLFRLIHVPTEVALYNHQQNLPVWGFSQREISGIKRDKSMGTKWMVISVQWPAETAEKKVTEASSPVLEPPSKPPLGFLGKFFECQSLLLRVARQSIWSTGTSHPYASSPASWPFLMRGVSMWDNLVMRRQVYLLGNPFAWSITLTGIVAFIACALQVIIAKRRNSQLYSEYGIYRINVTGGFFLLAWAAHYFPYFFMSSRMLFLYHYMTAFVYSAALSGFVMDWMLEYYARKAESVPKSHHLFLSASVGLVVLLLFSNFLYFSHLAYSAPMTTAAGIARQWLPSWEFLVTLHPAP